MKRILCLAAAGLFFALGVLGAILPVLPATPFLLLTSYFLVRSSPKLNEKMLNARLVGPVLRDWQERGGIRPDVKVQAIVIVAIAVAGTAWAAEFKMPLTGIVAGLALVGVIVIYRLPEAKP